MFYYIERMNLQKSFRTMSVSLLSFIAKRVQASMPGVSIWEFF